MKESTMSIQVGTCNGHNVDI